MSAGCFVLVCEFGFLREDVVAINVERGSELIGDKCDDVSVLRVATLIDLIKVE